MTDDRERGRKSKAPRRGRPPADEKERKDRLIQTRVEEDLDDALRAEARRRRVTVSQLIRNVLHDTFQLVDDVIANTASLTEAVRRDAARLAASAQGVPNARERIPDKAAPPPPPPAPAAPPAAPAAWEAALAWQEVTMGQPRACARCGKALARGDKGFLGVMEDPTAPRPFVCGDCEAALRSA